MRVPNTTTVTALIAPEKLILEVALAEKTEHRSLFEFKILSANSAYLCVTRSQDLVF